MGRPNLFIVGAPKAGTTSLCAYLSTHPQVFICKPKEPTFFARRFIVDERRIQLKPFLRSEQGYLALFSGAEEQHKVVGEASVNYLRFPQALAKVNEFNPKARIIVMLRNPVDLVQALHAQLLYESRETEREFARAWRLQFEREQGRGLPRSRLFSDDLLYGRMANLGEQLECVFQIFPHDHVKAILFEDFVRYTQETYWEVLDFLELERDARSSFPKLNERRAHRYDGLARSYKGLPLPLKLLSNGTKRMFGIKSLGINQLLKKVNTTTVPRDELDLELASEIEDYFAEDITKLERLLHRDLSHWRSRS